jgi:hypothetical protein
LIRATDPAIVLLVVAVLLATSGLVVANDIYGDRRADRTVCRALQRLDGAHYEPAVMQRIHTTGRAARTHLGHIVEGANGVGWPGHLHLVSEDYDYVLVRCADLNLPAPNVD